MSAAVATFLFSIGILGLFALNRDPRARTSPALWLPVIWLSISASRPVSEWLQINPTGARIDLTEGNPFERNIYICLIACGLMVLCTRLAAVIKIVRANFPVLLFVTYAAISIVWSDYPTVAFKRWIKFLGDLVLILVILTDPDRPNALKRVLTRVGFVLIPLSVLLIKYYPDLSRYYSRWEGAQFFRGVSADKNILGMCCLVFGLGSVWQLLVEWTGPRKPRILIAHCVVLSMAIWLFRTADSMTSLACFLLGSALMAFCFSRLGRKTRLLRFAVPAALAVCFVGLFFGGSILTLIGRDPTLTGRTELWAEIISMNPNAVLGSGFESFWLGHRLEKLWSTHWWAPTQAHNGYIETYLNLGWVGIVLVLSMVIVGYQNVFRLLDLDAEAGPLRLAFFVVALIYNCTEAAIKMLHPVWIAFLLAVIVLPRTSVAKQDLPAGKTEPPLRRSPEVHDLKPLSV